MRAIPSHPGPAHSIVPWAVMTLSLPLPLHSYLSPYPYAHLHHPLGSVDLVDGTPSEHTPWREGSRSMG